MQRISNQLSSSGYAFVQEWLPNETTSKIRDLLSVALKGSSCGRQDRSVDVLQPRDLSSAPKSHYSGIFGLGEFPLHTDLAFWGAPPRYIVLRCVSGTREVATYLLPATSPALMRSWEVARRAVFRPRKGTELSSPCVLSGTFLKSNVEGLRWDSVFLLPMNEAAHEVAGILGNVASEEILSIYLVRPGDTLVIDNWRALHGRSVAKLHPSASRLIERFYIST